MRLKITLEYFTSPGEELILVLSGGKSIAMEYVAGGRWEASLEMPSKAAELEYSFELHRDGLCVRREWGHHSVPEPVVRQGSPTIEGAGASTCSATGALEIRDRWQDRPEDSPFWTKAFTDVIFKRKQTSPKAFRQCGLHRSVCQNPQERELGDHRQRQDVRRLEEVRPVETDRRSALERDVECQGAFLSTSLSFSTRRPELQRSGNPARIIFSPRSRPTVIYWK